MRQPPQGLGSAQRKDFTPAATRYLLSARKTNKRTLRLYPNGRCGKLFRAEKRLGNHLLLHIQPGGKMREPNALNFGKRTHRNKMTSIGVPRMKINIKNDHRIYNIEHKMWECAIFVKWETDRLHQYWKTYMAAQ